MTEEKEKIIIQADSGQFEEDGPKKKKVRVLVFKIGSESYCVDIREAKEVVEIRQVTRVPNVPGFIAGVINLRGEVVALCDIRHFLGGAAKEKTKDARAVITDVTGPKVAFLVDSIKEAVDIDEESVQPPLATLNAKLAQYTKGEIQSADDILIYLDLAKLLKSHEIESLRDGEKK